MQLLMTLEPVVDDFPWPKFLLQVQHESKIAGITEVGEFWAMLDERKLSSAGYSDAADGQCNLIRNRLCDMQRKISDLRPMKSCILVTCIKQNGRFWNFIEPMKAMKSMKSDIALKIHRILKNFSKTSKNI